MPEKRENVQVNFSLTEANSKRMLYDALGYCMSRHYIHITAVKENFCLAADVTMLLTVRENKSTLRQSNSTTTLLHKGGSLPSAAV